MTELEMHDPFVVPDPYELDHEVQRPRWWYAAQLRIAGASWDEIAQALGYESGASANSAVRAGKRTRTKDELEDIVDLELERLDMLQLIAWKTAKDGDLKAMQFVLNVIAQRAKFLGTEKKPNEGATGTTNTAIFIGGDQSEYVKSLQQAREMVFNRNKELDQ